MSESSKPITLKTRLIISSMNLLGMAISAGGVYVIATVVLPVVAPPFQFMDQFLPSGGLIAGKTSISLLTLEVIAFAISLLLLVKYSRRFEDIAYNPPKELTASTWKNAGKQYFLVAFWLGLCIFEFIILIFNQLILLAN